MLLNQNNNSNNNYSINNNSNSNNSINDNENSLNDNSSDTRTSSSPVLNSPNRSEDFEQQYYYLINTQTNHNNSNMNNNNSIRSSSSNSSINNKVDHIDSKKPPLPKNLSNGPPRLKLDHPNTLPTKPFNTYATNSLITPSPSSPSSLPYDRPPNLDLTTDSSISPPMSIINPNINYQTNNIITNSGHNSRSFNDINDAILAPVMIGLSSANSNGKNPPAVSSFSPPSSIATTPTHQTTFASSFLRIYIGTSTAVIEKKTVPLQEVLYNKLKSRNLEVDKCIAYIKDN